ncbi:MAG: Flp pilus assembly complex ATPase component TadA [Gemmatimonadaceae bacterium]|nr:Flp pilus assembly complex ATPase component TadA [Gemmatimonadaceae bacterium]
MSRWGISLTIADWQAAEKAGASHALFTGDYLALWGALHLGYVAEEAVMQAIADDRRVQFMPEHDVEVLRVDEQAYALHPLEDLLTASVLPYELRDGVLMVLAVDPSDRLADDVLRSLQRKMTTVRMTVAAPKAVRRRLIELRRRTAGDGRDVSAAVDEIRGGGRAVGQRSTLALVAREDTNSESAVIAMVDSFLAEALDLGASDMHVEPLADGLSIRVRVDGRLRELRKITPEASNMPLDAVLLVRRNLIARFFRMAERSEGTATFTPVDGNFTWVNRRNGNATVDVRFSAYGTTWHDGAVGLTMRFLNLKNTHERLEACGFEPGLLQKIRLASARKDGIVLNAGPTGSGKSTTMHAILRSVYRPDLNVITIEDPVERRVSGYRQMEVRGITGSEGQFDATYPRLLRAAMRMDPDIILVGEIRDAESAEAAVAAANTGHFVLSTLHANTALLGVERLINFKVEPFLLSQSVQLLMAQRLVMRLCARCSTHAQSAEDRRKVEAILTQHGYDARMTWADAGLTSGDLEDGLALLRADQRRDALATPPDPDSPILEFTGLRHPRHCEACGMTGFVGRLGVFSLVTIDEELRRLMMIPRTGVDDAAQQMRDIAYAGGTRSLFASGLLRVLRGETALGRLVTELGPGYTAQGPL